MRILVVDDEKLLVKGVKFNLENEGYEVECAYDGATAVEMARNGRYDLIILDVMMPEVDGQEACLRIREFSNVPIIMLTAKSEDADKLMGFECGADDYVTKPFNPVEVAARVRSQLRRYFQLGGGAIRPEVLTLGGIQMDDREKTVTLDGDPVSLTPTEFSILLYLCQRRGKVVSSEELFHHVWGDEYYDKNNNTITVHIRHLREKMRDSFENPKYIQTVWGCGYKIEG